MWGYFDLEGESFSFSKKARKEKAKGGEKSNLQTWLYIWMVICIYFHDSVNL